MRTITCHGAALEVTGSKHLLDVDGTRVLVDCGVFQGRREEARRKNESFPIDPATLAACVNTHGHLDHCGAYPILAKKGYSKKIWATSATADVARIVMADSARIAQSDARHLEKRIRKNPRDQRKVVPPLYDEADAQAAAKLYEPIAYHERVEIAAGIRATLFDAGHILGSAMVRLEVDDGSNGSTTIVFTGDLGRRNTPILRDPEFVGDADWLVCESTYGARLHDDLALAEDELAEVVRETVGKGGRVLIPAFAIGRTQELVYHLHRLHQAGRIPPVPVFVDSPMAVAATEVFRKHPECYDEETVTDFLDSGESPFSFSSLRFIKDPEESRRLNGTSTPCVIISASGMCEAGRILHHLEHGIGDHRNTILVVGYMAEHTLGRALADRRPQVRIFGEPHALKARVKILNSFSAHADRNEIGAMVAKMNLARLRGVLLVHGEPRAQDMLAAHLRELGVGRVESMHAGIAVPV